MPRTSVRDVTSVAQHADVAFEQAAIGMALVDFSGAFLAVNQAFCELVGRPEQELLRITWQSITAPDDVRPGEDEVAKTIAGEERTFRLAKRYIRPDGDIVWVLLSVSLMTNEFGDPECLFTQVVDITEQRRAEEELARLASIVESCDDAIVSTDVNGTVLTWNRAAERMYGYRLKEMIGRKMTTILPPERRNEAERLIEQVRRGESVRNFETVRMRKDNSIINVSLTVSPIFDSSGVAVRVSNIARDITEQKRTTAALDRTLAALEVAVSEARESEARSRRFFSDAAHHLRNPLAGIRASVETLLRGADARGQERLLAEMARETWRASRLVDRLLRIARLEQGDPLTLEPADIVDLCQDQVERAQSLAPHLAISLLAAERAPIDVDAHAVREILASLLENARGHAASRVDLTVVKAQGAVSLHVSDDGPGLPPAAENVAFEPFVSLDGKGGFGLGLTVSRALARAHGGDLIYGDGSFVLTIPSAERKNAESEPPNAAAPVGTNPS